MAASNETPDGLNELHGQKKPDDVGLGEWIWGALQGDFNAERSTGQIGFDMAVSLIPVVDTLCDVRDLCANVRQYRNDPTNKITLFFIATTVIGFIPELGTVVKSVLRLVWVYMKPLVKHADDITNTSKLTAAANRACESALPKITEYLQHNRVAKWATNGKLPDVYKFVAITITQAAAKVNPGLLNGLLNSKCDDLKSLLKKIRPIVPSPTRERLDDLLSFIDAKRQTMSSAIQEFALPVRIVLRVLAKKLHDKAWHVETHRNNPAFIAPISESGSAKLIELDPPAWVTKHVGGMEFPPLDAKEKAIQVLMDQNPTHPRLTDSVVETFSKKGGGMRADTIVAPAKLYRVVDPSNEGAGVFWISEAEFKSIKNREDWRRRFAIKPEWNQNGWVVEYELKPGESLQVWRGPAASQELKGTQYYLEGGGEQIVFFPNSRDKMVDAMPRVDRETGTTIKLDSGDTDRRVEFTDLTGETIPVSLRAQITDPHIKGPIETGWGATDYTPQEARRILLTAPNSP